jgi:hypothetical protein
LAQCFAAKPSPTRRAQRRVKRAETKSDSLSRRECLTRKRDPRTQAVLLPNSYALWRKRSSHVPGRTVSPRDRVEFDDAPVDSFQVLMKSRRSALTWSLWVVHRPCGAPL